MHNTQLQWQHRQRMLMNPVVDYKLQAPTLYPGIRRYINGHIHQRNMNTCSRQKITPDSISRAKSLSAWVDRWTPKPDDISLLWILNWLSNKAIWNGKREYQYTWPIRIVATTFVPKDRPLLRTKRRPCHSFNFAWVVIANKYGKANALSGIRQMQ